MNKPIKKSNGNAIVSVSIPIEMREFCYSHALSPSHILRAAIEEKMKYESGELLDSNASLIAKIGRLSSIIQQYTDFLNKKGYMEEYIKDEPKTA